MDPTNNPANKPAIPENYEIVSKKELRQLGKKSTSLRQRIKSYIKGVKPEERTNQYILKGKDICAAANMKQLQIDNSEDIKKVANNLFDAVFRSNQGQTFVRLRKGQESNESERLLLVHALSEDKAFVDSLPKDIDLKTQSLVELKGLKEKYDDEMKIRSYPETVKTVLSHLKERESTPENKQLINLIHSSHVFREYIDHSQVMTQGREQLMPYLQGLRKEMHRQEVIESVMNGYEKTFAQEWKEMEVNEEIQFEEWINPQTNRDDYFAEKYAARLNNPLISKEFIKLCLPDNLKRVIDIDTFTKEFKKEQEDKILFKKIKLKPDQFQQFLVDIPIPLTAKNFEKIAEFYTFYVETYKENKEALSALIGGLHESGVLMSHLEENLPKLEELIKYGMKFTKVPGYPAETIGKAMAAVLDQKKQMSLSVEKGVLFGQNITDSFKTEFQGEVFRTFVKEVTGLSDADMMLHMNYYKELKYPVTKENLIWVIQVGQFIRNSIDEGYPFLDINAPLVQNLPFNRKPNPKEVDGLPQMLATIAQGLKKPEINPGRIIQEIHDHPVVVLGAVLDKFLTPLLPEDDRKKAGVIHDGFRKLDALISANNGQGAVAAAVQQMQQLIEANRPLAETLLPLALNDPSKAIQQLLLLSLTTIQGNLEVPPKEGGLPQLKVLVELLMTNAKLLKTDPENSLFSGLPTTTESQKEIRQDLKKLRFLTIFDSFLGKKVVAYILERSGLLKQFFPAESQEKVSQVVAPMAAAFAAALPNLLQKFQVDQYLDYLWDVGRFNQGILTENELEQKTWKLLEYLVTDVSQFSDKSLPDAFHVIRMLGA